jgi:hypothetical protein
MDAVACTSDEPGKTEYVVVLTNHPVNVLVGNNVVQLPQSGSIARTKMDKKDRRKFAGFLIERDIFENVYGLPDPIENTIFIVSDPVLRALNGSRGDVVGPGRKVKGRNDHVVLNLRE